MRILVVEQGGRGGIADYVDGLTTAQVAAGDAVTILTATDHRFAARPGRVLVPAFRYVRPTNPVARWIRRARLSKVLNGLAVLAVLPRLLALARAHDVVHLHGAEWAPFHLLFTAVGRLGGARVVYTVHNTFERGARDFRRTLGLAERLAQALVVHSTADADALEPGVRAKATVIPHGEYTSLAASAPTAEPAAARLALGLDPEIPVVLLFGVLRPDKGLDDLLAAARDVDGLQVLVCGEDFGALGQVADLLADPALAGRVTVREGFAPLELVGQAFAAADVVALPYKRASASGVLLLAYGFDTPVVAYPSGGLGEYLEAGETAWLAAAAEPGALTAELRDVVAQGRGEAARRGAAARRFADERLAWPAIAERTAAVYAVAG